MNDLGGCLVLSQPNQNNPSVVQEMPLLLYKILKCFVDNGKGCISAPTRFVNVVNPFLNALAQVRFMCQQAVNASSN